MAEQINALTTKLVDLSSITGTHMVERTDFLKLSPDSTHMLLCMGGVNTHSNSM